MILGDAVQESLSGGTHIALLSGLNDSGGIPVCVTFDGQTCDANESDPSLAGQSVAQATASGSYIERRARTSNLAIGAAVFAAGLALLFVLK